MAADLTRRRLLSFLLLLLLLLLLLDYDDDHDDDNDDGDDHDDNDDGGDDHDDNDDDSDDDEPLLPIMQFGAKWAAGRKRPSDYERLESAVYEKHLKSKVGPSLPAAHKKRHTSK